MKKALLWLWLLTKRLYKKPTFLAIMLLIPLLVFGYQGMSEEDTGMITIALAKEADDPIAEEIMADLQSTGQLFRYMVCDTPVDAKTLVQTGKADAAWIFPEDMAGHIDAFLDDPGEDTSFVQVIQQEKNVALLLTRERLCGAVYHHVAQRFYLRYTREEFADLQNLSDEELMEYFYGVDLTENLFTYDTVSNQKMQETHYLMAPVRGMLAIVIVLCGMASAMYYIKDCELGTFGWVSHRLRPIPELACQTVAVLNVGVVTLIAMILSKVNGKIYMEIPVLLLYTLCVSAFCMMLRALFHSIKVIGALIPVLIVVMLLICPVFFDFGALRYYQFLFPPTYYINAAVNPQYILYMAVYTLLCGGLYLVFRKVLKRA